jgi:hypothetical protein
MAADYALAIDAAKEHLLAFRSQVALLRTLGGTAVVASGGGVRSVNLLSL